MAYTKPKTITINDKITQVNNWKEVLLHIVEYALELDKEKLIQMAIEGWSLENGSKEIFTNKNLSNFHRKRVILEDSIYMETNFSANAIWKISTLILDEFYIDRGKVGVYISDESKKL